MDSERYAQIVEMMKSAIVDALPRFTLDDRTRVDVRLEKGKLVVEAEGQKWIVSFLPRI